MMVTYDNTQPKKKLIDRKTAEACLAVVQEYLHQNEGAHVAIINYKSGRIDLELEGRDEDVD